MSAQRVLVVGLGERGKADPALLVAAGDGGREVYFHEIVPSLSPVAAGGQHSALPEEAVARLMAAGLVQGCVGPGLHKSKPDRFAPQEIWLVSVPPFRDLTAAVRRAQAETEAVNLARELVNMPPCDLYPETFAARAAAVAEKTGLVCQILDRDAARTGTDACAPGRGPGFGSARPAGGPAAFQGRRRQDRLAWSARA